MRAIDRLRRAVARDAAIQEVRDRKSIQQQTGCDAREAARIAAEWRLKDLKRWAGVL